MSPAQVVSEVAKAFKPLDAAAYLRLHGWAQQELVPDRYALWTKADAQRGDFEVLLPLSATFIDLAPRIAELLTTLEIDERRPMTEIAEDLMTPHCDVIRARLSTDTDGGTLPIEDGAGVFARMRDLLLAAACAAISPRRVYAKRKPDRAMSYLQEARFGQTARGSYVLTVLSPVTPSLTSSHQRTLSLGVEEEPFSRQVVRTLATALSAASAGTQNAAVSGSLDAFEDAVEKGVSANLCEAIIGLSRSGGRRGLEFSFSWAPSSPEARVEAGGSRRFSPDAVPYLERVSKHFRKTGEIEEVEVFGVVHKLQHLGDAGRVTIVGTADGEQRSIVTELRDDQHRQAVRSYDERLTIACVGELAKEGASYRLRNVRDFRILEEQSILPQDDVSSSTGGQRLPPNPSAD
jgi:hypothetical protein